MHVLCLETMNFHHLVTLGVVQYNVVFVLVCTFKLNRDDWFVFVPAALIVKLVECARHSRKLQNGSVAIS